MFHCFRSSSLGSSSIAESGLAIPPGNEVLVHDHHLLPRSEEQPHSLLGPQHVVNHQAPQMESLPNPSSVDHDAMDCSSHHGQRSLKA